MRSTACIRPLLVGVLLTLVASNGARGAQNSQDHTYTTEDVQTGSRLYAGQCAQCHGTAGDTVSGINLRRGQFRRPMSDDDLRETIAKGASGTGMPPFALQRAELDGLVAFMRAGFEIGGAAARVGDAVRGRTLFEGKGRCASCHRVNGTGPRLAPDLSDIGALRSPAQFERSLTEPVEQMMPINRPVRIVTRDGRTILGRRLNEDTYTVQLIDQGERLLSIDKAEIREFEIGKTSPMPRATDVLSRDELADVVGYLVSLRGQP